MSNLPEIMKVIAKRQLSQSVTQRAHDQSLSHPQLSQSSDKSDSINDAQSLPNPRLDLLESANSSQASESKSEELPNMAEVKQFFTDSQYQKLKILYPTFQEAQIRSVAGQIWETMLKNQKKIYYEKWVESKAEEDKIMNNYLDIKPRSEELQQKSANIENSNIEQASAAADNILNASQESQRVLESPEFSAQDNEGIQSTTQSEGDGRSNAETNTSSIMNDQSNHTALPLIYTLVECQKSNSDESSPNNNSNKASVSSLCSSKVPESAVQTKELNDPDQLNFTTHKTDLNQQPAKDSEVEQKDKELVQ